jgi:hypothetical protein
MSNLGALVRKTVIWSETVGCPIFFSGPFLSAKNVHGLYIYSCMPNPEFRTPIVREFDMLFHDLALLCGKNGCCVVDI